MPAIPHSKFRPVIIGFLLPIPFWIYFFFSSSMVIRYDAEQFEILGKIIAEKGWLGFFKVGPTLEPLFPLIIATSMKIAASLGVSYLKIQTLFQLTFFFLAQCLLYTLLKRLRIRESIITAVLLYFGFSPGLLKSSFSLFSEVITYPLLLGCVLVIVPVWQASLQGDWKKALGWGLLFTILATMSTFTKAMLEYIFLLFLLPFFWFAVRSLFKKETASLKCTGLFLLIFLIISQSSIAGYKSLNLKYNGCYTFTDFRGPYMFYHYTVKRTAPLTKDGIMIPLLSIPGENVCRAVYGDVCEKWWYDNYSFALKKAEELETAGYSKCQICKKLIPLGFRQILTNPVDYGLLTIFETIKLLFWESTKAGYVNYPAWLVGIYEFTFFKNILRLTVFFTTAGAFIFLFGWLVRHRHLLLVCDNKQAEETQQAFFMLYFLIIFMLLYSLVITITRYAFPIASFYLAAIAITANEVFKKK